MNLSNKKRKLPALYTSIRDKMSVNHNNQCKKFLDSKFISKYFIPHFKNDL